jgi:hypothetical protein
VQGRISDNKAGNSTKKKKSARDIFMETILDV